MYSLYSKPLEFNELSANQKRVIHRYVEIFKEFYYNKSCSYQELAENLINKNIVRIVDYGDELRKFIKKSIKIGKLPVVILTHPFVINGLRIPSFDGIEDRNFPYDFSIFLDIYGIKLASELSSLGIKKYGLKRLYNSIPTWDDMLKRIGVSLLYHEFRVEAMSRFYEELLLSTEIPIIWFYPGGISRGYERLGRFKKGILYLLKQIEEDRRLLDLFKFSGTAVCFVDQYNIDIVNNQIVCRNNVLHQFTKREINNSIEDFRFGTDLLADIVNKRRRQAWF